MCQHVITDEPTTRRSFVVAGGRFIWCEVVVEKGFKDQCDLPRPKKRLAADERVRGTRDELRVYV